MKRFNRNDVTMLVGVVVALLVMFQRPIQYSIRIGRDLEDRYGLAFLPGLAVLCVVFSGHYFLTQLNRAAKRRRSDQTSRLVTLGQALARATSMNTLRNRLRQYPLDQPNSTIAITSDERVLRIPTPTFQVLLRFYLKEQTRTRVISAVADAHLYCASFSAQP